MERHHRAGHHCISMPESAGLCMCEVHVKLCIGLRKLMLRDLCRS